MRPDRKAPDLRLRQGAILLGGAPLVLLAGSGPLGAAAVVGLAALAGGRRDRLWLAAAVLLALGWIGGDPGPWAFGVGLAGALSVLVALSPGRRGGTGPGPR